ncbi:MAG: hypothetical protein AXW14_03275 [Alteromonas sp. Nap_26]|nr:MAG: hypothetical protein AXW14_03275 [Alteromonas sp. Nap_26]
MKGNKKVVLWRAFLDYYRFAPQRQWQLMLLMLIQGLGSGVGLLFIIPLLQLIGLDLGHASSKSISGFAIEFFHFLHIPLTLASVLLSYVVIVVCLASVRYLLSVQSTQLQQAYTGYLRDSLYRILLHSRWAFITQNKMSDFTHTLTGQVQSIGHTAYLLMQFSSQIVVSAVLAVLAFALSWQLSLLALGLGLCILLVLLPINKRVYKSGDSHLINYKSIFQMLSDQLGSLKMIKSYASEQYYADRLKLTSDRLEIQQVKLNQLNALTSWVYLVVAVVAFSVFFYVARQYYSVPIPTLLLLLIVCARLLPLLSNLQKNYQQLLHKVPSLRDVEQMRLSCQQHQENLSSAKVPVSFEDKLVARNISFRYPTKSEPVFEEIFLSIERNETVALVGPSGSGKSTLADILGGLLLPDDGKVVCDNVEINQNNLLAWRSRVAYVTQEVYLFHDTIRNNLCWVSKKTVSDEQLWEVLKLAAAEDFVDALPEKLDSVIGDRGIRLSGGERQRLAMARALLSNPLLLILDEATSALDNENEAQIQKSLERLEGKLTILIIAHRETTIQHVKKRIELGKQAKAARVDTEVSVP